MELGRSPYRPRVKTIGDTRRLQFDDVAKVRWEDSWEDKKAAEALQVLISAPKELNRKAAQRLLRYVKTRTNGIPVNYFKTVLGANRHHLFQDSFDIAIQMLREDCNKLVEAASDLAARRFAQKWKSKTVVEAMKGLPWKNVLWLLDKAGHFTNLYADHWDEVYLGAAQVCQEFKWPVAMAVLEETVQRHDNHKDSHVKIPQAKVQCAAMAHWSKGFATWRAIKEGDADAKASTFISTISERMDRSGSWSLSLEMISELQRQRVESAVQSLRNAQMVCSQSSQWASVLALQGLMVEPQVEWSKDEIAGRSFMIEAACRSLRWQEALSMVAGLPTPSQVATGKREVRKSYYQVILACGRSKLTRKAIEVCRQGRSDPFLIKALLPILASDPAWMDNSPDSCHQALMLLKELREVKLRPGFTAYQAVLDIMEWKLHPEMLPEILDAVAGELNQQESLQMYGRPLKSLEEARKKRIEQRLELEKAFLLLEAHGRDVSRWRYAVPRNLPTRQDLSFFTSRSFLDGHCELPMEASWSPSGRHSLRTLSEVVVEDSSAYSCHAWIQYQVFVPATTRPPKGRIPPVPPPLLGRWLSCRGRRIGNGEMATSIAKQDPENYGPPLSVRNALLQVIAMVERPHFGEIVRIGRGDYGFIFCPEPELDEVFFQCRMLPHDEWTLGQKVSFALDYKRPGERPHAVFLAFEESIPPLLPRH